MIIGTKIFLIGLVILVIGRILAFIGNDPYYKVWFDLIIFVGMIVTFIGGIAWITAQ